MAPNAPGSSSPGSKPIQRVAVVGAGNMGGGIAQTCAQAGLPVHLADVKMDLVEKARKRMADGLGGLVSKGKMGQADADVIVGRVAGFDSVEKAVADADLVIEAVFEDLAVKSDIFAKVDAAAPAHCIIATNTSSLSVTEIGAATKHPERVAGLHFFFPAMINKLVEVVRGERTSAAVDEALMGFSRRIGKVPIRTADSAGFAVNRFFVPFLNEACRVVEEGVASIPTVEKAANRALGTGMGPFELMNVTGVPIALHAQRTLHAAFGPFYAPSKLLEIQVGRKADWDLGGAAQQEKLAAVERRLTGVLFGIASALVHEKVATPADTDKGAVLGLRWRKGPFALMNDLGILEAAARVREVAEHWGKDFPVPGNLEAQAGKEEPWPLRWVRLEREHAVGLIVIDRQEALNALNDRVLSELEECLDEAEADPALRCLILTGEGRAFISGADLKEMAELGPEAARPYTEKGQRLLRRFETSPIPIVAAVNGYAFGGGLETALACDFLLASEKATMGLPEVGLGIVPGFGGTQRLAHRVGVGMARQLIYTGETIDAAQAKAIGLANEVLPPAELLPRAKALARTIASKGPYAVAVAKRSIDRSLAGLGAGLEAEKEAALLTFGTEDKKEGMRAFLEKRKPKFQGR